MRRSAAPAVLAAAMLAVLVGCAPTGPPGPGTPAPSAIPGEAPSDAPAPVPDAPDPQLDAFLAAITGQSPSDPDALVAAIESAGFPRSGIERTREVDSLGAPVTFLQVAVLDGDSCIVGQVGEAAPLAVRASPLGGGRCLVGEIVTVD